MADGWADHVGEEEDVHKDALRRGGGGGGTGGGGGGGGGGVCKALRTAT